MFATLAVGPGAALAGDKKANHCINPAGVDLNEFYGTQDALITPFCSQAHVGDHWRPLLRANVAAAFDVIPPGYVPSEPTPEADFLAKLVSGRYVVDAGTRQERTYVVQADRLVVTIGDVPDGTRFISWTRRLHPLSLADHSVDMYVTLSADHWDGLGVDPAVNRIPAGESLAGTFEFVVSRP